MSEKLDAPTSSSTETSAVSGKDNGVGGPKAIIKNVDMSEELQQEAVDIASAALEKYNIEKDIAAQIKKEFDKRHGPTWHVVVGKNFGSYVTHGECLLHFVVFPSSFHALRRVFRWYISLNCSYTHEYYRPETKHFIYFYVGSLAILIWKS